MTGNIDNWLAAAAPAAEQPSALDSWLREPAVPSPVLAAETAENAPTAEVQHTVHLTEPEQAGTLRVIAVWGARPGVGASGVALAIADAAAAAGDTVALVDCADPARSGLSSAAAGGAVVTVGEWTIRVATRELLTATVLVLRSASPEKLGPAEPKVWLEVLEQVDTRPTLIVVDTGWDLWHALGPAGFGAAAFDWCRTGGDLGQDVHPCLVVDATLPAAVAAEQTLTRAAASGLAAPERVAVIGAARWPEPVWGAAGVQLRNAAASTVFVPRDPRAVATGWGEEPLPTVLTAPWVAWVDELAGRPVGQGTNRRPLSLSLPFKRSNAS